MDYTVEKGIIYIWVFFLTHDTFACVRSPHHLSSCHNWVRIKSRKPCVFVTHEKMLKTEAKHQQNSQMWKSIILKVSTRF